MRGGSAFVDADAEREGEGAHGDGTWRVKASSYSSIKPSWLLRAENWECETVSDVTT